MDTISAATMRDAADFVLAVTLSKRDPTIDSVLVTLNGRHGGADVSVFGIEGGVLGDTFIERGVLR